MKNFLATGASILCFMVLAGGMDGHAADVPSGAGDKAVESMASAANAFLKCLDDTQLKRAKFGFADPERENWHYVPMERGGIPLGDLQPKQRELAMALLSTGLSQKGTVKASTIMSLEQILAEAEHNPVRRNPEKYYFAIFGEPGNRDPWGWRIEGHHLAVNFTIVPGVRIHAAPSFLGSNPAEVKDGPKRGLRVLAAEEDLARALTQSLLADGKNTVVFTDRAPAEILTGADRQAKQLDVVGIAAKDMSATQAGVLRELISEYLGRNRPEVAAADWKKIEAAGFGDVHFGWAGATEPGKAWYYRIQGEGFLFECANSQNNANHVHAVWRDINGDFGRDSLGQHYQQDHDH